MTDPNFAATETPRSAEVWAWLSAEQRVFHAAGELRRKALPEEGAVSFYVNDFALSDAEPWRVPGSLETEVPAQEAEAPEVVWEAPGREEFRGVFEELMGAVRRREILKAVPVASATGEVRKGNAAAWLRHVLIRPAEKAQGIGFGWMETGAGVAGFTPEVLFQIEGRRLTTMALAGTTDAEHAAELTERPKLGREHAVVVDELQRRLAQLGEVRTGRREVVRQGTMRHLRTPLEVTLAEEPSGAALNDIIRLLHPTPALGISPRTETTMSLLTKCRERTGTPRAFGAPFGVAWPGGALFVVAIRAAFWQGDRVVLPAGGGLVAGSEFENEWAELELKRAWVRRVLGL